MEIADHSLRLPRWYHLRGVLEPDGADRQRCASFVFPPNSNLPEFVWETSRRLPQLAYLYGISPRERGGGEYIVHAVCVHCQAPQQDDTAY